MKDLKSGEYEPMPLRRVYIPLDVIMQLVADQVADGNILGLVQRFLTAGVMENGVFKPTTVGTPQGGIISPLLANIVLNQLDWELDRAGFHFVRYADDFVVLTRTPAQAQEAKSVTSFLVNGATSAGVAR